MLTVVDIGYSDNATVNFGKIITISNIHCTIYDESLYL